MPGYNGLDYLMQEFFATERKTSGENGNIIADYVELYRFQNMVFYGQIFMQYLSGIISHFIRFAYLL